MSRAGFHPVWVFFVCLLCTLACTALKGVSQSDTPTGKVNFYAGVEFSASAMPKTGPPRVSEVNTKRIRGMNAMSTAQTTSFETSSTVETREHITTKALEHLQALREQYGLTDHDLMATHVKHVHRLPHGSGPTIVTLMQTVEGIRVHHAELKLLMHADTHALLGVSGALAKHVPVPLDVQMGEPRPTGSTPVFSKKHQFHISEADAIAVALSDLYGVAIDATSLSVDTTAVQRGPEDPYAYYAQADSLFSDPARIRRVLFPYRPQNAVAELLLPAYALEVYVRYPHPTHASPIEAEIEAKFSSLSADSAEMAHLDSGSSQAGSARAQTTEYFAYVVSATPQGDEGEHHTRILSRQDLTHRAFDYRVWADGTGYPADTPMLGMNPNPKGSYDGSIAPYVASTLVNQAGFDIHGDVWLTTGATTTQGNNVWAYADLVPPDGFTPASADTYATRTGVDQFDRVFDPTQDPQLTTAQTQAAITQMFYTTNWLHDAFYNQGFDEAAGNAQVNNYGRGGLGGDPLFAEGQDFGGLNNANMQTPADGMSPRMQMYVFIPREQIIPYVSILPGGSPINAVGLALFGKGTFDITATGIVWLAAAGGNTACSGAAPQASVAGKVVIVYSSSQCSHQQAIQNVNAQNPAGIVYVNALGDNGLFLDVDTGSLCCTACCPTAAVIVLGLTDGNSLRNTVNAAPATQLRIKRTANARRDGTVDNLVVAHEWGHYLHHRLTECNTAQCGAMSEGWADFIAMWLSLRPSYNASGTTFSVGYYAVDNVYFGFRRYPYSTSFNSQPLTFRHVQPSAGLPNQPPQRNANNGSPNNEVHNAGEVWAQMLFECYTNMQLLAGPGQFTAVQNRMAQYVVGGMKLAPVNPGFLDQRDALLLYIYSQSPTDGDACARAFAVRGAGSCAVSPPQFSSTFEGVVEDFTIRADPVVSGATLTDDVLTCDHDRFLDVGEAGTLRVTVSNQGGTALANALVTVRVTTGVAGYTVNFMQGGPTRVISSLAGWQDTTLSFPVNLTAIGNDALAVSQLLLAVNVSITATAMCTSPVSTLFSIRANTDLLPHIAVLDSNDSPTDMEVNQTERFRVWSVEAYLTQWHGWDWGVTSDTAIQTPSPGYLVSSTNALVLQFDHAFSFEADGDANYDGGVVEYSVNDGNTWIDITRAPGFSSNAASFYINQQLDPVSGNPLTFAGARYAFTGLVPSWPFYRHESVSFSTALAGRYVRFRWRLGTDESTGDFGWLVDNIRIDGLVTPPFAGFANDRRACDVCDCDPNGALGPRCASGTFQCACGGPLVQGRQCDRCPPATGNNLPLCNSCTCNAAGSVNQSCSDTNQCFCANAHVQGPQCDRCPPFTQPFPNCAPWNMVSVVFTVSGTVSTADLITALSTALNLPVDQIEYEDTGMVGTLQVNFYTVNTTALVELLRDKALRNDLPVPGFVTGVTIPPDTNPIPITHASGDSGSSGLSNGAIAGIVIAILVMVAIIVAVAVVMNKRQGQAVKETSTRTAGGVETTSVN